MKTHKLRWRGLGLFLRVIRQWLVDTGVRVNRHFIIFSGWLVHCSRSYCWLPSCWDVIVSDYYHFLSHKPPTTYLNLPPPFYPQIIFRDELSKEIFDVQNIFFFNEGTKRTRKILFVFSVGSQVKFNKSLANLSVGLEGQTSISLSVIIQPQHSWSGQLFVWRRSQFRFGWCGALWRSANYVSSTN